MSTYILKLIHYELALYRCTLTSDDWTISPPITI
nr:MAG TPA: hypothetical protein [Caudoviricetes sp.]